LMSEERPWSGPRKRTEGSRRRSPGETDDEVGESPWGRQKLNPAAFSGGVFCVFVLYGVLDCPLWPSGWNWVCPLLMRRADLFDCDDMSIKR